MPRSSSAESSHTSRPAARPYQSEGIAWLRGAPRRFLADEPGLGKSRQLIEASRGRTLVVAPAMVLDGGTWDDEIARWADDPSRFEQVPYSGLNSREWTGKRRPDGSKNLSATRPTAKLREEYEGTYDTVILDESQYIKSRDAKWTEAVLKLDTANLYLASGTPIPNWAHEVFTSLQLLHPGECAPGKRFGSYWRWAKEWFDCSPTQWSQGMPSVGELLGCLAYGKPQVGYDHPCFSRPATDPCEHYLAFHVANFGDDFLQRKRDEVLTDLPPLTVQQVMTPMVPKQAKAYRELRRDFISFATGPGGSDLVAWNSAALNEMLTKISVGLEVIGAGTGSGKLDRLRWDISGRARPTLVVAHHQDVLEAAQKHVVGPLGARSAVVHGLTSKGARSAAIADFKAGRLDVLLGSLDTIAEGLTLTAADVCIMLQKSYKPSRNTQAIRRIHRLGQDRPCTVLEYLTPDSVDFNKEELLATKNDRQMRHLTAAELARIV